MTLFRNYQGEWVLLVRTRYERFIPRCFPTDVARVGTDHDWVQVFWPSH